tara:strand:+ start:305 stop:763 length:459 start_codon:yes stop_codon:yes gene_type:complete
LKIREANIDDRNDIFEWRNDPITRQMSFDSDVVTFSIHKKWFENSLYNKNRYLLIVEEEGRKISVVRFDIKEEKRTAEISINLNPLERGKIFSSTVISKSISYFNIINNKRIKTIIAKIKKKNIASKRSFMKCGFKLSLIEGNTEIYNFVFL